MGTPPAQDVLVKGSQNMQSVGNTVPATWLSTSETPIDMLHEAELIRKASFHSNTITFLRKGR